MTPNITKSSGPLKSFGQVLRRLSASLRRKKLQIRALRLNRHKKEAVQGIRRDIMHVGVPAHRLRDAVRDPLQPPDMEAPDY